jgi:hypothetical protein
VVKAKIIKVRARKAEGVRMADEAERARSGNPPTEGSLYHGIQASLNKNKFLEKAPERKKLSDI